MLNIPWTVTGLKKELLRKPVITTREIEVRYTAYVGHVLRENKYKFRQHVVEGVTRRKTENRREKAVLDAKHKQFDGFDFKKIIRTYRKDRFCYSNC